MKRMMYAYIDDYSEELLINLAAQGFYAEAYELMIKLEMAFHESLYSIAARGIVEGEQHGK